MDPATTRNDCKANEAGCKEQDSTRLRRHCGRRTADFTLVRGKAKLSDGVAGDAGDTGQIGVELYERIPRIAVRNPRAVVGVTG